MSMTKKDKDDAKVAHLAIAGQITWGEAASRMNVSKHGVHHRICSVLRKEALSKQ